MHQDAIRVAIERITQDGVRGIFVPFGITRRSGRCDPTFARLASMLYHRASLEGGVRDSELMWISHVLVDMRAGGMDPGPSADTNSPIC